MNGYFAFLAILQRIVSVAQSMTVYKPISPLAPRIAEAAKPYRSAKNRDEKFD